jgi:hypothetical protein
MADAGHRNAVIVPAELEPIVRDLEDDDVVAHLCTGVRRDQGARISDGALGGAPDMGDIVAFLVRVHPLQVDVVSDRGLQRRSGSHLHNRAYVELPVDAQINYCPKVIKAMAAPLQTSIGNDISVYAIADDPEDDPIEYRWTGTGGRFADPNAAATTYTCEKEGDHWLKVEVSDDGFDFCHRYWKVLITCVRKGGGTGGSGGGGTGGTGGIIVNHCAFYTSLLISPLSVSVGHDIDVATRVHDHEGDDVEVRVSSDCGEVEDPLQTADPGTGEADTTVRCDQVSMCEIVMRVSDDGFDPRGCSGLNAAASSVTQINCQPPEP